MRRPLLGLLAALALLLALPAAAGAQAELDCRDFPSRAAAQAKLDADPGDPHRLDADDDGQACENFNYASQGADAGGGDDNGTGRQDALPFTGPAEQLLPLGFVLLVGGTVLAFAVRRRPRHARQ